MSALCSFDPQLQAKAKSKNWPSIEYPFCRSSDGEMQVNFDSCTVYIKGKALTVLPLQIQALLSQGEYIPGTIVEATGSTQYEFTNSAGKRLRLITDESVSIIKQCFMRDEAEGWLRLLFSEDIQPLEGWMKFDAIAVWVDDKTGRGIATKGIEEKYELCYRFQMNPEKNSIIRMEQMPKSSDVQGKTVLQVRNSPFAWIERFEKPENILLLGSSKGVPERLELARCGLTFQMKEGGTGTNRWMCGQESGYFLAPVQYAEVLEKVGIQHYLLLENEQGAQQIFLFGKTEFFLYSYRSSASRERLLKVDEGPSTLFFAYQALASKRSEGLCHGQIPFATREGA